MADGSLIFDTKIQSEGFDGEISNLTKALERLTKVVGNIDRQISQMFTKAGASAAQTSERVDNVTEAAQKSREELKKLQKEKAATFSGTIENNNSTSEVPASSSVPQEILIDWDKLREDSEKATREVKAYSAETDRAANHSNALKAGIEALNAQLKTLSGQGLYFKDDEYDEAYIKLNDLKKEVNDYKKSLESPVDTTTMEGQIEALKLKLQELKIAGKGLGEEEYNQTAQALRQAESDFSAYKKQVLMTKEEQAALNAKLEETRQKEAEAAAESARLTEIGQNAQVSSSYVVNLRNELERLTARQKDLLAAGLGMGHQEYDANASKIALITNRLNAYKKGLLGVDSAQKKVTKSGTDMGKSSKKTKAKVDPLSKSILRLGNMFKLLLVRMAMRAIIASAREGFENLAQYSDETNASLSALMSSGTLLKNSFAAAFAPVVDYATPALVQFVSVLAEANNMIAQLMAAMTGKDSYVKAVAVQEDYAESLNNTSDAIKKTSYSFDTLIQRQTEATDKTPGKADPSDMFETVEVENQAKVTAEKIKDTFSKLFEPMKDSWDNNGPVTVEAAKNAFASLMTLAGHVGASFLQVWDDEGYGQEVSNDLIITLGNMAQTVANLSNRFDEAWMSGDIGTNIIRHLGDILLEVTGFFRQASESIKNWSASVDFKPLLKSFDNLLVKIQPVVNRVGKVILWLLNDVLEPLASWTIEDAIPVFLDLLAVALDVLTSSIDALTPLAMWLWESFLQPLGQWTGEIIIDALKALVDCLLKLSDWIREHQGEVEAITIAVIAFFAAWTVIKFVNDVMKLISSFGGLIGILHSVCNIMDLAKLKYLAIAAAIGVLVAAIYAIYRNWDKMTPTERVIAGILAAAAAVGILAVALGALAGGIGAAVVAASLAAGIAAATIAINAGKRATSVSAMSGSNYTASAYAMSSYGIPRLATGTVVPPRAGEFAAILGDNNRDTEVVSPVETMKQAFKEAIEEMGGLGGNQTIKADMIVEETKFAQLVYKFNNKEKQRVGVKMVTEG